MRQIVRRVLFLFGLLAWSVSFMVIISYKRQQWQSLDDNFAVNSSVKVVLLWTSFFGSDWLNFYNELGSQTIDIGNDRLCRLTTDRKHLQNASALIFHGRDLDLLDLPRQREKWQRWVFFLLESPMNPDNLDGKWKRYSKIFKFNWTMTYSSQSDIPFPYGHIGLKKEEEEEEEENQNKTNKHFIETFHQRPKDGVWFVSNCVTKSRRENVVSRLQANDLEIDIYGACSGKSPDEEMAKIGEKAFFSRYRFRIAFENSICEDYVTEKFFNALKTSEQFGVVPIVLAGSNHSKYLTSKAFVTIDLGQIEQIAFYLKSFKNKGKFSQIEQFYDWHQKYTVANDQFVVKPFHELCQRLWTKAALDGDESDQVTNIFDSFGKCIEEEDIYRKLSWI